MVGWGQGEDLGACLRSRPQSLVPANASAMTTTLGQLAPGSSPPANCIGGPDDLVPANVDEGNGYTVPASGTITQWSTNAAVGAGQTLKLKVDRKSVV